MNGKSFKLLQCMFYALVTIFIVIASYIVIPGSSSAKRALFPIVAILAISIAVLGGALLVLTLKLRIEGKLKHFLILTGASATGSLFSVILHNFIYGLSTHWFGRDFWDRIGLPDEPFFFVLAVFVCPILFLIGTVGTIVFLVKTRKEPSAVN